ncbi:glycosyltransferase [Segetibacter aerophilus]|uniref:Glycosyl transferase n=1 Tax=Segetibacter aerophilus TaxID=670293 RepID=A0A512BA25_9BACT|nr:nucleotide disphospho-sugar-binding domain-containing protein [Segetibacter aerophilus]GEO08816.1 glycosyl transferase [Segetibacter aerophilus]
MLRDTYQVKAEVISKASNGKKILFATVPADGHVNPLTGLAVYLKGIGYDVRWYTSNTYAEKITKLNIPHFPFIKALDARGDNMEEVFPERAKYKTAVAKVNFDIINFFIKRSTEYYEDIKRIYRTFPFDLMIADCCFTAIPFVKEKMNIPVISIGILPLTETSKDLPPSGLGITPSKTIVGKLRQSMLRWLADNLLFAKSTKVLKALATENNLSYNNENIFDYLVKKTTLLLQSGTPGFEYRRSDMGSNIKFAGPFLPFSPSIKKDPWFDERLNKYDNVILVTQGTVEKDVKKLIVPTLEAFKDTDVLVVVTTGGSRTKELRQKYPHPNIIIEDFIPFSDVMPYADAYISNGGYGGVLLAIENELPLVAAGIHEGKNEICARIGYFKLGINLRTERPTRRQMRRSIVEILNNYTYKQNVKRLAAEFAKYNANEICAKHVSELIAANELAKWEEPVY